MSSTVRYIQIEKGKKFSPTVNWTYEKPFVHGEGFLLK